MQQYEGTYVALEDDYLEEAYAHTYVADAAV
jgi:hypothetical protein